MGVANGLYNLGALNVAAGTFDLNSLNQAVGTFSGSGAVTLGSAEFTVNQASDAIYAGVMSGTGSLVKQGSAVLTLSAANTYSGGTHINAVIPCPEA